jgi:hypothetical protein
MGLRQECINFVPPAVERERVRARFRHHYFLAAHCFDIDDIYYAWVSDRNIKTADRPPMQKYYVRRPAQSYFAERFSRIWVDGE